MRRNLKTLPLAFAFALCVATGAVGQTTALTTVRIASGFSSPLNLVAAPADERLFIQEQYTARIRIIKNGTVLATPFLDINLKVVNSGNERGFLGLAFHPGYRTNGYFYVSYNDNSGRSMIERYNVSAGNPDIADPGSAFTILGPVSQPFSNHNGGHITFGPDDKLYIGLGDGGSGNDPFCNAQKGDNLLGKILRLNDDGTIPTDNPFFRDPNFRSEIWHYGLRNPWRFSFDRREGHMYIGDVGQNAWEEIDYQPVNRGGLNYGWKIMEGNHCNQTSSCPTGTLPCFDARLADPIHEYVNSRTTNNRSVTGGFVYRGCAIPDLRGTYFFADYQSGRIWSFKYNGSTKTDFTDRTTELRPNVGAINRITSFGEDARGEIYIVDRDGEIFKIVPRAAPPATDLGFGKVGGNGRTPLFDACGLLTPGNSADFRLRFAPPNTPAVLALGNQNNPTALLGGTLVPFPPVVLLPLLTTPSGHIDFNLPGGTGPAVVFAQYLLFDSGASFSTGFSNALQVNFQ